MRLLVTATFVFLNINTRWSSLKFQPIVNNRTMLGKAVFSQFTLDLHLTLHYYNWEVTSWDGVGEVSNYVCRKISAFGRLCNWEHGCRIGHFRKCVCVWSPCQKNTIWSTHLLGFRHHCTVRIQIDVFLSRNWTFRLSPQCSATGKSKALVCPASSMRLGI